MRPPAVLFAAVTLAFGSGFADPQRKSTPAPVLSYKIQRVYPHDPTAFTQGLEYADGFLYEGTGLNGRSSIRKVKLETGAVVQNRDVPPQYFGEGITIWQSNLIELTWTSEVALVYDRRNFDLRRRFSYVGEGWGLTHDKVHLIMSDGTSRLRVLDPATFVEIRRVSVTDDGVPVRNLNELEFVKGEILANVWLTDRIARIDPGSGRVTGWIALGGLLSAADHVPQDAVLNGIAYDERGDRLFVTGKLWPKLFEIKITEGR